MKHAFLLALALLPVTTASIAGTPIDQTRDVAADATIKISNVKGAVHVSAWDQNKVHVTGTLGDGSGGLQITRDGNTLSIKVKAPAHSGWFNWGSDSRMDPSTLNVQVPKGASLGVDVVSATADIKGLDGGKLNVNSVSGDVRIDANSPKLDVDAVSSRVELHGRMSAVGIQTVSGDIIAPQVDDKADLETVSGQMHLGGGPYASVNMNTVSGDIELGGGLKADGKIEIDSVSGDVRLHLPATLSARIKASTFSGSLHSDFGSVTEKSHGPGSSLNTRVGHADGRIDIQTFSGDVRVEKGN